MTPKLIQQEIPPYGDFYDGWISVVTGSLLLPPPFLILPHVSNKAQDRKEEKEKNKHESYTIKFLRLSILKINT